MSSRIPLSLSCLPVIDSLFYGLREHLQDLPGASSELVLDIAPLEAALAQQAVNDDPALQFKGTPPGKLPDHALKFVQAYLEVVKRRDGVRIASGQEPLGALALRHAEFDSLHRSIFGTGHSADMLSSFDQSGSIIDGTAQRAWHSYRDLERYGVVLNYVAGTLGSHQGFAMEVLESIQKVLIRRSAQCLSNYARLSLMSTSPDALNSARRRIYAESFRDEMWLGCYLAGYEAQNGGSRQALEDQFRKELRQAGA